MRDTSKSTVQTTCDTQGCKSYSLSIFFSSVPESERRPVHYRKLALEGWVDHEGRDYCQKCKVSIVTEDTP